MLYIITLLFSGLLLGRVMRRSRLANISGYGVKVIVPLLLFVFGASLGADGEIAGNIGHFGWQAVVIALLGVAGSVCAAMLAVRILKMSGKGGAR